MSSDTVFPAGRAVTWETRAPAPGDAAGGTLVVRNEALQDARAVSFTAELVENAGRSEAHQRSDALVFPPGDGPRSVPLGDGQTHQFFVFRLDVDRVAVARGELVLRAGDDGVFRRELEISVEPQGDPVTVSWRALEVVVEAKPATNRTSAELHPAHAARILSFFNGVEDPRQIVETIRDNRSYRRDTRRAYAVRARLAASILAARKKLPGGLFETLQQLEQITGVGPDTFEDIAFTFEDDGTPLPQPL